MIFYYNTNNTFLQPDIYEYVQFTNSDRKKNLYFFIENIENLRDWFGRIVAIHLCAAFFT